MNQERRLEIRVGLFVVGAIVLGGVGVLLLGKSKHVFETGESVLVGENLAMGAIESAIAAIHHKSGRLYPHPVLVVVRRDIALSLLSMLRRQKPTLATTVYRCCSPPRQCTTAPMSCLPSSRNKTTLNC